MNAEPELIARREGMIGWIQLNRPRALNALSFGMIRSLTEALDDWRDDDQMEAVVVTGSGDRAFCAGGDVKSICRAGSSDNPSPDEFEPADYFREEYTLIYKIASFPKPYLSWLDGITMGGGVGISIFGTHRIASEYCTFAMPETAIGFFPDVGGSYFMSRMGPVGTLLSLTGRAVNYRSALALGIATHFIPRESGAMLMELCSKSGVAAAVGQIAHSPPPSDEFELLLSLGEQYFSTWELESIIDALRSASTNDAEGELARDVLSTLEKRSPTSMKVTMELLRRGSALSLRDCLAMEFRLSLAAMSGHDFFEGVRATLVDKDHAPQWKPATITEVDEQLVDRHFEELGEHELQLP